MLVMQDEDEEGLAGIPCCGSGDRQTGRVGGSDDTFSLMIALHLGVTFSGLRGPSSIPRDATLTSQLPNSSLPCVGISAIWSQLFLLYKYWTLGDHPYRLP